MEQKHSKTIGVFGGSFNPPHNGHSHAIATIAEFFPCDEIWVMPSDSRRDKTIGVSGEERLAMLQIMIQEFFQHPPVPVIISSLELDRRKPTSTYDTLQELRQTHPNDTFYFMVNSDVVGDIRAKWVNGEKLFTEGHFLVMQRPPFAIPNDLPPHTVLLKNAPVGQPVTSTEIRSRVAAGKPITDYVTKGVAEYISHCKLYR